MQVFITDKKWLKLSKTGKCKQIQNVMLKGWLETRSDCDQLLMEYCQSGKSATIRESNHGSGVCKEHYA